MNNTSSEAGFEYDPAYLNALRELYVMLAFWGVSLLWTIGYCGLFAYRSADSTEPISIIWGVPGWAVWGIAFPWCVCGLFTICFSVFYIRDDDADLLAAEISPENVSMTAEGPASK